MGIIAKGICSMLNSEMEVKATEEVSGLPIMVGYSEKHTSGTMLGIRPIMHSTPAVMIQPILAWFFSSTLRMSWILPLKGFSQQ